LEEGTEEAHNLGRGWVGGIKAPSSSLGFLRLKALVMGGDSSVDKVHEARQAASLGEGAPPEETLVRGGGGGEGEGEVGGRLQKVQRRQERQRLKPEVEAEAVEAMAAAEAAALYHGGKVYLFCALWAVPGDSGSACACDCDCGCDCEGFQTSVQVSSQLLRGTW